jgi:hypothetical protein
MRNCLNQNLRVSDDGVQHPESPSFWTLFIVQNSKQLETLLGLLGPLERDNCNNWGLFRILNDGQNPEIH